jgi:hypothetical protein
VHPFTGVGGRQLGRVGGDGKWCPFNGAITRVEGGDAAELRRGEGVLPI